MRTTGYRTLIVCGVALLLTTAGCSSLLGEDPTSTIEWHTVSPTDSPTPTAPPTTEPPTFEATTVLNSHESRLRSMAFTASLEVVTIGNGSEKGRDSVRFVREPGRLHYRLDRSGSPVVMVGGESYLGFTFEHLSIYGEDERVYRRMIGANQTFVHRVRDSDMNDPGWATTNDTRQLGYLTDRMVVLFGLVPEDELAYTTKTNGSTRVHWDGGTLETPVSFAGIEVLTVRRFSATIRDGIVRSYRIAYVVRDDGTQYTVHERATFDPGATFERPEWVPNGTATPPDRQGF